MEITMVSLGMQQMYLTRACQSARAEERRTAAREESIIRERIQNSSTTHLPTPLVDITMDYLADDIVRRYVQSRSDILSLSARITGAIQQLHLPSGTTVTLDQLHRIATQYGALTELTAPECTFNFATSAERPSKGVLFRNVVRLDLNNSKLTGFMLAHIGWLFPRLQTLVLTSCTLDKSDSFDEKQVTTALNTLLTPEERRQRPALKIEGLKSPDEFEIDEDDVRIF